MYASSSRAASSIASTSHSSVSFDSRERTSPLYTLDYQVPVHSLEDSVAILRQAHAARGAKKSTQSSTTSSPASSIRMSLSRFSSRLTTPTLSYSTSSSRATSPSRKPSRSKTDISHLLMASDYAVPVYDLEQSVKILRQPRNGRQ